MTTRDLDVYHYHPRRGLLWAPVVVIIGMAIFGFVRGLMGASDISLDPGFGNRSNAEVVGKDPKPVILETIPSLTPTLIGVAPPPPKAPVAVNAPVADVAAINAPIEPVKVEAAPPAVAPAEAPPTAPTPAAPPAPPPALQGLY